MSLDQQPSDARVATHLPAQMWQRARRNALEVILLVLLVGAAAGGATRLQAGTYVSTVSFVVQTTSGASDTETLIRTMQALVSSEIIGADLVEQTESSLTPDEVVQRIEVRRPPGAGVFTVAVTDTDTDRSRELAAALVPVFQERVDELSTPQPGQLAANYSIRPWGAGTVNTTTTPPPTTRNAVLGVGLGGLLVLLLLAVSAQRNPLVLNLGMAAEAYRSPVLGALPRPGRRALSPADALGALLPHASDLGWPVRPRCLLVFTPDHLPDHAGLLLGLADHLSQHVPVAVVDASSTGDLTRDLGLTRRAGLADVHRGLMDVGHALVPNSQSRKREGAAQPGGTSVTVLTSGRAGRGKEPAGGKALAAVLDDLTMEHTVVLEADLDPRGRPWGPVLDRVDAVLVLTVLGRTTVQEARSTGDTLLALTDRPVVVLALRNDRFVVGEPAAHPDATRDPASAAQQDPATEIVFASRTAGSGRA